MRLDKHLQEKFSLRSRTYAENLIKTGGVSVNGKTVVKPSYEVLDSDIIALSDDGYASQGAYKLEEAFLRFSLNVKEQVCLDIGCSNGGFTDCLIRHGARFVYAVDVADCALQTDLLNCGQVKFVRANARELPVEVYGVDFVCSDVSFISLKHVLPEIFKVLKEGGEAVVLIKPQFELDKSALGKSGIVTDEKLRRRAVDSVKVCALTLGFKLLNIATSPIRYQNKNIEYLLHLQKPKQ